MRHEPVVPRREPGESQEEYAERLDEYARCNGRTPDEQYAHDRETSPGYAMLPYSRWIGERWREYKAEHGINATAKPDRTMQEDFTAWLRDE